jgi:hypothetical protein
VEANPSPQPVTDSTKPRYVTSYAARRAYREAVQHPPAVQNVGGAIDIHCHAHEGQQDALDLAKHASASGMSGILFKTIVGGLRPTETQHELREQLHRWCDEQEFVPVQTWVGWQVARGSQPISAKDTAERLDGSVGGVWMPVFNSVNTLTKVGVGSQGPMPEEEARKIGFTVIDEHGHLLPEVRDIIHLVADRGVPLSFSHGTHEELWAMAEEVERIGFDRAFVDHPFSPFVDLSVEEMKHFAKAGIWLNFTYDELSPLLGVDPAKMYEAIREVGPEHVTLSSDAGEPLFPNSVECMRLMRGYMRAFGLTDEEVRLVSEVNPGKIMGAL